MELRSFPAGCLTSFFPLITMLQWTFLCWPSCEQVWEFLEGTYPGVKLLEEFKFKRHPSGSTKTFLGARSGPCTWSGSIFHLCAQRAEVLYSVLVQLSSELDLKSLYPVLGLPSVDMNLPFNWWVVLINELFGKRKELFFCADVFRLSYLLRREHDRSHTDVLSASRSLEGKEVWAVT